MGTGGGALWEKSGPVGVKSLVPVEDCNHRIRPGNDPVPRFYYFYDFVSSFYTIASKFNASFEVRVLPYLKGTSIRPAKYKFPPPPSFKISHIFKM